MHIHREFVARAIVLHNDAFLTVSLTSEPHLRFLPGGKVEFGEKIHDALARELKEELAETVTVGDFVGCIEHEFTRGEDTHYQVNFFFLATITKPHDVKAEKEDLLAHWSHPKDFNSLDIRPPGLKELLHAVHNKQHAKSYFASNRD